MGRCRPKGFHRIVFLGTVLIPSRAVKIGLGPNVALMEKSAIQTLRKVPQVRSSPQHTNVDEVGFLVIGDPSLGLSTQFNSSYVTILSDEDKRHRLSIVNYYKLRLHP
jgi:hypothetical protein